MIAFNRLACLRTDHTQAACSACLNLCAKDAFVLKRTRLEFVTDRCTGCGGCVGGCPSEALALEGFDESHFSLLFAQSQTKQLSCRENTPCLGVFGAEHLAVMALKKNEGFACDLSHCAACEHDPDSKLAQQIHSRIKRANDLLKELGHPIIIDTKNEQDRSDRRSFFTRLLNHATHANLAPQNRPQAVSQHATPIPKRRLLLERALEPLVADKGACSSPLFAHIDVQANLCTGCQECVRFCPTRALKMEGDEAHLTIDPISCITCGICTLVCREKAITPQSKAPLSQWCTTKALVHFQWHTCQQCGTYFAAQDERSHCRPCGDFVAEFDDMFVQEFARNQPKVG